MKDYYEITVRARLNVTIIVRMPGLLNKFFTNFHKKIGRFYKKLMVYYVFVSTIVDLLKGGTGQMSPMPPFVILHLPGYFHTLFVPGGGGGGGANLPPYLEIVW